MALGKKIGDFSFKMTSVSYGGEDAIVEINCDGTADGFGTVLGTLTLCGEPGGKSGPARWRGDGFLESGEVVQAVGSGTWEELGKHQWRTRMVISVSDGQTFASDAKLDLASRSFTGVNLEWS